MGKHLKIVSAAEPEAEARRTLAEAIARVETAAEELRRLNDAVRIADERRVEARAALAAVQRENAAAASSFGEIFVQAMRSGQPCNETKFAADTNAAAAREAEAARAIDMWREAEEQATKQIAPARSELEWAQYAIPNRIAAVVTASGRHKPLLEKAEAARGVLIRYRSALAAMVNVLEPEEEKLVRRFLSDIELPGASVIFREWGDEPECRAWVEAAKALATDANARLPEA